MSINFYWYSYWQLIQIINQAMCAACAWDFCTMQMRQKQAVAGHSRIARVCVCARTGLCTWFTLRLMLSFSLPSGVFGSDWLKPRVILFLSTNGNTRLSCRSTEPLPGAITDPNELAALGVRSLSSGHVGLCRVCPVSPRLWWEQTEVKRLKPAQMWRPAD